jgi:hypothetical protein
VCPQRSTLTSVFAAAAAAALLPSAASACPLCFAAGSESTVHAYYVTAALLSLLPLVIIGVFAGWLRQRFKDAPK